MKKCDKCNKEYNEDYLFCPACGGVLVDSEERKEETVNVCASCGVVLLDDYEFCPKCGTPIDKNTVHTSRVKVNKEEKPQTYYSTENVTTTRSDSSFSQTSYSETPKKKVSKRTVTIGAIILGGLAALILCLAMCSSPTKELTLNGDETLDLDMGESVEISEITIEGEDLTEADVKDAKWTAEYYLSVSVKKGKIVATADPQYLDENEDGTLSDTEIVTVTIKNDNGKWEGSFPVEVNAKVTSFDNKEIIIKPDGSRDSYVTIEPSKYENMIFYFRSKDDLDNNMAFYVKKGTEKFEMEIPPNNYDVYLALGDKWYGDKAKFGEFGNYYKFRDSFDFANYTWTLPLSEVGEPDTTWSDMNSLDWNKFPIIK